MSATAVASIEAQRAELVRRIKTASDAAMGWTDPDRVEYPLGVCVHRYERYAAREGDLRAHYLSPATGVEKKAPGILIGWHVRRVSTVELEGDSQYTRTAHRWRALAIMALNDPVPGKPEAAEFEPSEIVFDRMLECVRAKFREDDALIDPDDDELLAETTRYEGRQGFQIDDSGPVMFAGVLCHMARCSIVTVCSEEMGVEATDDFETAGLDITDFSQDQRYLDGSQMDVGARAPPAADEDHDFENVTDVRTV